MFYIYHLLEPSSGIVRYVGRCTSPKARLRNHCNEAEKRVSTLKHRWINALLEQSMIPIMVIVAICADPNAARKREQEEYDRHRHTIFNIHAPDAFPAIIKKGNK